MNNGKIDTTSALRGKRNTYSVLSSCGFLQNGDCRNIGILCILFMESLIERGFEVHTVVAIGRDLQSFFEYIEEKQGVIADVSVLERSHVEEYTATVCRTYEAGQKTFTDALNANVLLNTVRMLFLYLQSVGAVAEDYGRSIPLIPYPDCEDV